jgi:hypothetical protein
MPRMGASQRQLQITATAHCPHSVIQFALRSERSGQGMRASHWVFVMRNGDTASHSNLSWRSAQPRQAISTKQPLAIRWYCCSSIKATVNGSASHDPYYCERRNFHEPMHSHQFSGIKIAGQGEAPCRLRTTTVRQECKNCLGRS